LQQYLKLNHLLGPGMTREGAAAICIYEAATCLAAITEA